MLLLAAAFLQKYEDGIILFYDSEFGSTESYISSFDIDPERIIHSPIFNIEQLTHDITVQLEGLTREDHVIIIIDSIGNLASIKEIKDALEGSDKADMTRAKKLKGLGRIITPHLTMKDIPLILVNHVYKEMAMFPKTIVGGGQGMYLSSDNIWIIGRRTDKDKKTNEIDGYEFIINVEKSRFVKEKSQIPITVSFSGGINRWSGLLDLAVEGGYVLNPIKGKYARAFLESEIAEPKKRDYVETSTPFWRDVFEKTDFSQWLKTKYQLPETSMLIKEDE
jgi:RecA/RadA recombinase